MRLRLFFFGLILNMTTHYNRIGGVEKLRALVTRFYRSMDELPESYGIRQMHPDNLQGSQNKQIKYLCGWTGGPALCVQQYGHSMQRRRHLPFPISDCERDQWLLCMNSALRDEVEDADLRRELSNAFAKVADHMRNIQE